MQSTPYIYIYIYMVTPPTRPYLFPMRRPEDNKKKTKMTVQRYNKPIYNINKETKTQPTIILTKKQNDNLRSPKCETVTKI